MNTNDRSAIDAIDKAMLGITNTMFDVVSDDRLRPDVRVAFVLTAHRTGVSLMRLHNRYIEALLEVKR